MTMTMPDMGTMGTISTPQAPALFLRGQARPPSWDTAPRVVMIDNYDSFTFNLVQYLRELGATVTVLRNDETSAEEALALQPTALVVSPGPCDPDRAGVSLEVIRLLGPRVPTLGVCLGHQCIGQLYGGRIVRAPEVVHGKISRITHDGRELFAGLPNPLDVVRYHSLTIDPASLPAELEVTATAADGTIMAVRHRALPLWGVQFHPESILTQGGKELLNNFLVLSCQLSVASAGREHESVAGSLKRSLGEMT